MKKSYLKSILLIFLCILSMQGVHAQEESEEDPFEDWGESLDGIEITSPYYDDDDDNYDDDDDEDPYDFIADEPADETPYVGDEDEEEEENNITTNNSNEITTNDGSNNQNLNGPNVEVIVNKLDNGKVEVTIKVLLKPGKSKSIKVKIPAFALTTSGKLNDVKKAQELGLDYSIFGTYELGNPIIINQEVYYTEITLTNTSNTSYKEVEFSYTNPNGLYTEPTPDPIEVTVVEGGNEDEDEDDGSDENTQEPLPKKAVSAVKNGCVIKADGVVYNKDFGGTVTLEINEEILNNSLLSKSGFILKEGHGKIGTYALLPAWADENHGQTSNENIFTRIRIRLDVEDYNGVENLEINICSNYQDALIEDVLPPIYGYDTDFSEVKICDLFPLESGQSNTTSVDVTLPFYYFPSTNGLGPSGIIYNADGTIKAIYNFLNPTNNGDGTRTYDEVEIVAFQDIPEGTCIEFGVEALINANDETDYNYDLPNQVDTFFIKDPNSPFLFKDLLSPDSFYATAFAAGLGDGALETVHLVTDLAEFGFNTNMSILTTVLTEGFTGLIDDAKEARDNVKYFYNLLHDPAIQRQILETIENSIGTWFDQVTFQKTLVEAGYQQGKLIFEVAGLIFGVEEAKLLLKTGKFGDDALSIITKMDKVFSKGFKLAKDSLEKLILKKGDNIIAKGDDAVKRVLTKVLDDVYDTQKGIIEKYKGGTISSANNSAKGVFGEVATDVKFSEHGFESLHIRKGQNGDLLDDWGGNGIDHIFQKDGRYYIVESKYGTSTLSNTADGLQMSDDWIRGSGRLQDAVGDDIAQDILDSGYTRVLSNIDSNGNTILKNLDETGVFDLLNP